MSTPHPLRPLLEQVCDAFATSPAAVLGPSRKALHVQARFSFVWLAHSQCYATRGEIARFLGRDRTTITHSLQSTVHAVAITPHSPFSCRLTDLSRDLAENLSRTPPANPTTTHMHVRLNTDPSPQLNIQEIASAARRVHDVLAEASTHPGVSDIEMLTLLRETATHCMSHYNALRVERRRRGLEADPFVDDRSFDAWITMATEVEPARQAQRTQRTPGRNRLTSSTA